MSGLRTFGLLYMRTLRQFPRIPTVLVFGIAMPAIQILLFGSIFSSTTDLEGHPYHGENYYAFISPAIVLLTAFLGMANSSAAFLVDLRTGYFDKLRTTPASPVLVIAARLAAEMTRVSVQSGIVLLIAIALDARIKTGILGALALIGIAVLFSALTTGLIVMMLAMRTKSDQATQSAFPLFFVFLFLSTAYMPEPLLPGWLREVIVYNPVDYLIQGMRTLMFDGWVGSGTDIAIGLGISGAVGLVLIFFNRQAYRRLVG
jgi:ABC-2 type transport system permease protein